MNAVKGYTCPHVEEKRDVCRFDLKEPGLSEFEVLAKAEMMFCIRTNVARFAATMPFSSEEINDIKIAVGEAGANALKHGCSPDDCNIKVKIKRLDRGIKVSVCDSGSGFVSDKARIAKDGELTENGRGIICMKALMDKVVFKTNEHGTCVELTKRFHDAF